MPSLITQAMTSNTAPAPYVASASSNYLNYDPFKAFDKAGGATTSSWSTNAVGPPAWLKIDLGTAQTATSYSLTPISNGSGTYLNRSPATWTVDGSNDNATWTTVDSRSGVTWPAEAAQSFTVATPGSYRYYRLNVTANAGGGAWVAVGEWDLIGSVGTPAGTLSGTLSNLAGSFAATHTPPPPEGTLSGTLPALAGSFQAEAPVAGPLVGTLPRLEGSFAAESSAAVETSARYANLSGYNYLGESDVDYDPPVIPPPTRVKPSPIHRVHQSLPVPALVDGRPV